jgi:integrase
MIGYSSYTRLFFFEREEIMAEKRRDSLNRVLRDGEYQRADGRYEYRYTDKRGERHSVYSWRLNKTDRIPVGKRCKESLREMEDRIQKEIDSGVDTWRADKITLDMYFTRFLETHKKLKPCTRESYSHMYWQHVSPNMGSKPLSKITTGLIVDCYIRCAELSDLSEGSISVIHTTVSTVLTAALEDKLIPQNPANTAFRIAKGRIDLREKQEKIALTQAEQDAFLHFVRSSKAYSKHYALFVFLFGTGCRIGEALGLVWDDIDFDKGVITISRQLQRPSVGNKYLADGPDHRDFRIVTPKSKSGTRVIPLFPAVREALLELRSTQTAGNQASPVVDGVAGFVFTARQGTLLTGRMVRQWLNRVETAYSKANEGENGGIELPHITPHVFRHTFCTRLCESGLNLQVVQKIMGHSDIATTTKVYNHVYEMQKANSFANVLKVARPV